MLATLLFICYFITIFTALLIISVIIPRITKQDKDKPMYIYIGYYFLNSIIMNFIFSISPLKTIFSNLILLLFAHILGLKLRVMGLTGQICSGKSTAAKYLVTRHNAIVIDLDKLNREVLEMNSVKLQIRKAFGDEVFDEFGVLDKLKMRKIIFSDDKKRKQLEAITHKSVFKSMMLTILKEKLIYGTKYLFIENAILLRFTVLKYICFPILSVCTHNKAELVRRVMNRDSSERDVAEKILEKQLSVEEFVAQSDYVVFNDTGVEEMQKQIDIFMSKLK